MDMTQAMMAPGAANAVVSGGKKEQIKALLGAGCTDAQVAAAVGCDRSYISQLMLDQEFANAVVNMRLISLQDQSARDGRYDSIEDQLLAKLEEQLPMMLRPDLILRAIVVVNSAKRRGAQNDIPMQGTTNIIQLILPSVAVKKYQVNVENNVIEVDGQPMIAMPSRKILDRLKQNEQGKLPLLAELTTIDGEFLNPNVVKSEEYINNLKREAYESIKDRVVVEGAEY